MFLNAYKIIAEAWPQFRSTRHERMINMDVMPELDDFAMQWGSNYMVYKAPDKLLFPDNSIDAINCSHMLEHLNRKDGLLFIQECHRVLKVYGTLRITVPDAELLVNQYWNKHHFVPEDAVFKDHIEKHKVYNLSAEQAEDEADMLFHLLIDNHATIYDSYALEGAFRKAEFKVATQMMFNKTVSVPLFRTTWDMYPEIPLYVEGVKEEEVASRSNGGQIKVKIVK